MQVSNTSFIWPLEKLVAWVYSILRTMGLLIFMIFILYGRILPCLLTFFRNLTPICRSPTFVLLSCAKLYWTMQVWNWYDSPFWNGKDLYHLVPTLSRIELFGLVHWGIVHGLGLSVHAIGMPPIQYGFPHTGVASKWHRFPIWRITLVLNLCLVLIYGALLT